MRIKLKEGIFNFMNSLIEEKKYKWIKKNNFLLFIFCFK